MTLLRQTWPEFLAVIVILLTVVLIHRAVARQSAMLGYVVGLGLLVRLAAGTALFSISYFNLPILSMLHTGDGFWQFAPDARSYYSSAVHAATYGLDTIQDTSVSPAYVRTLALWLRIAGANPASGFLLNLVCYVLVCGLLVGLSNPLPEAWRGRTRLVTVGAFTGSPALILFGTQTLKDTLFALLMVLIAVGAYWVARALDGRTRPVWRYLLTGGAILFSTVYVAAGIRPYFAFIAWACFGLLFAACCVRDGLSALRAVVPAALVLLLAVWVAFLAGAGPQGARFETLVGLDRIGTRATSLLFEARSSYVQAGGGTSLTGPTVLDHERHPEIVATLRSWEPADHARAMALGLATLFVPIRLLQALSIVEFDGGRSLLALTDIDTLFLDFTIIAVAALLVSGRSTLQPNIPYAVFAVSVALLLTVLMAYVVTNYGTLVRLRLMLAISVWMLPLAMQPGFSAQSSGARQSDRGVPGRSRLAAASEGRQGGTEGARGH